MWEWQNTDPFGNNVPNENPSGLGQFEFPLRFTGQVADKETNTFYNTYRDAYDPAIGRYTQFDPIGLAGGINGYIYVKGNPLSFVDPLGLESLREYGERIRNRVRSICKGKDESCSEYHLRVYQVCAGMTLGGVSICSSLLSEIDTACILDQVPICQQWPLACIKKDSTHG